MSNLRAPQDVYLSHFSQLERQRAGRGQPRLDHLCREALDRFAALGFPTTRQEEWKYTNVAPIAQVPFRPAGDERNGLTPEKLARLPGADVGGGRLVFVNGHWAPRLSTVDWLPQGVIAESLAAAPTHRPGSVEQHLGRYANHQEQAFVALNTAFINDGVFVEIPQGRVVEEPIHLLFLTTPATPPTVTHPRVLIVAGPDSQATLVESYLALGQGQYFTNAVTEVVAGENARIDHCRVQREAEQAFHVATLQVEQGRNSAFSSYNFSFGGSLVRHDINAVLAGAGSHCALNGLYLAGGQQHVDNHTLLDHAEPHGTSHELYKGILGGRATGVFNGAIRVRKDAQKTDAIQHNKNLLLSEDALINSKPQLEIHADDVKCTHGATVGQLNKDALFYLRTRGVGEEAARRLLIYAFASEVLGGLRVEPLRAALEEVLSGHLPARPTSEAAR